MECHRARCNENEAEAESNCVRFQPQHKIQSGKGSLVIEMDQVPKVLRPMVQDWAPEGYVVSFKVRVRCVVMHECALILLRIIPCHVSFCPYRIISYTITSSAGNGSQASHSQGARRSGEVWPSTRDRQRSDTEEGRSRLRGVGTGGALVEVVRDEAISEGWFGRRDGDRGSYCTGALSQTSAMVRREQAGVRRDCLKIPCRSQITSGNRHILFRQQKLPSGGGAWRIARARVTRPHHTQSFAFAGM